MPRLTALNPDHASGKTKELFSNINLRFGAISNMMRTMGNSPVLLEGFLNFYGVMSTGSLNLKTSELIALAVSEANGCGYCLAAHQYVGGTFGKLSDATMAAARKGTSEDLRTDLILKFAQALVVKRGAVTDADVTALKNAGITETEIAEIIGQVALHTLTNYFNIAAGTELDAFLRS